VELSKEHPQRRKPDSGWKLLVSLLLAGLVSAASVDLWAVLKMALQWLSKTGGF
jgi:hypothetical protein